MKIRFMFFILILNLNVGAFECHFCHEIAHTEIPIVYGLAGPELLEKARAGEVLLGGCVLGELKSATKCGTCGAFQRGNEAEMVLNVASVERAKKFAESPVLEFKTKDKGTLALSVTRTKKEVVGVLLSVRIEDQHGEYSKADLLNFFKANNIAVLKEIDLSKEAQEFPPLPGSWRIDAENYEATIDIRSFVLYLTIQYRRYPKTL